MSLYTWKADFEEAVLFDAYVTLLLNVESHCMGIPHLIQSVSHASQDYLVYG